MKHFKKAWPYLLIITILYYLCPLIYQSLSLADSDLKNLFVNHILLYQPFAIFALSLIFSTKNGLQWWFPLLIGFLFWPADYVIYPFAGGVSFYVIPYAVISLIACLLGWGIYCWEKRKGNA